jgi:TRAP transporter TAXI family solute receptor
LQSRQEYLVKIDKVRRRSLLLAAPAMVVSGRSAIAQVTKLKLGTALEGGLVQSYGIAFVDGLRGIDPLLEIRAVTTKGIQDNVMQLEEGKLDLALVFGEVAHELFTGVGRPPTKLRAICAMYSTPGMFVVRSDSRYRTIADLKERRVVWNARNGGLAVQARYVMQGLDLDPDKDFEAVYTTQLREGPDMVIDGRAAALWGAGHRWPGFVAVASSSRGARFIAPDEAQIKQIREKYPFLARLVVPANLYPGQYEPIPTVGTWSFVLARADLPDKIGFRLAAALHKAERSNLLNKSLTESTVKNTLMAIENNRQAATGLLEYYKKAGLVK